MKRNSAGFSRWFPAALILCCLATPLSAQTQVDSLISFTLEDQFETVYTDSNWANTVIVFLGTDREGSEFSPAWGKAIHDSLRDNRRVAIVPVSDLDAVPFFLKGYVRGKFPKERDQFVLLDWDGIFSESYEFREGACNILIFNTGRKLVYQRAVTKLDEGELRRILAILLQISGR